MKMRGRKQMKKVMERTRDNIFCRLPALLLCALLLSACGSGDKAEAASGDPGASAGICGEYWWKPFLSLMLRPNTGRDILIRSSGNSFGANLGFQRQVRWNH